MRDSYLTRIELDGTVEHREGQQFINGRGFSGDQFQRVHRIEPHGFASHPVQGGIGIGISTRGNRESSYVLGGENPKLRPEVAMGGTAIYDHAGNIVSIVAANLRIVHSAEIHLIAPSIVLEGTVKLGGPDAGTPASMQGTVDTGGFADVSNLATMVLVK